jgi:hypothetical protein
MILRSPNASTMSSATLTDAAVRLEPGATDDSSGGGIRRPPDGSSSHPADQRLQPWQFFVLVALASATAVTFLSRGQGAVVVVLLSLLMGTAALAGLAALRTLLPLVSRQDDRTKVIGERTRAALEREKMLALRAIKELEFDKAMGKVSEEDFKEMSARLRSRASRLIRQLDAGAGYREKIERDLAKRMGEKGAAVPAPKESAPAAARACAKCSTMNDPDARFCKECGTKL